MAESAAVGTRFGTIFEIVARRGVEQIERLACRFLSDGRASGATLTYRQLDGRVRRVAARLTEIGAALGLIGR